MNEIDKKIWDKFHIKKNDTLPFTPWLPDANRHTVSELFAELGYKKGAEIGVRMGEHAIDMLDCNLDLELLLIDTWEAYGMITQEKQDRYLRRCTKAMKDRKVTILKMSSMDALKEVPDGSLDFVYIDGCHMFDYVIMDIICWSKKVRSGGIISGHDFYAFYQSGVIQAVTAYTSAHGIQMWYVTKKEPEPTWFWVK